MPGAASEQDVVCEGRESDLVDLLREGLRFQNNLFVDPLPHSDSEVGVATDTRQFVAGARELNMGVQIFRTVPQNSIELETRVLIDIDVRHSTLLGDREVLLGRVH